jgi:hypothetical protein
MPTPTFGQDGLCVGMTMIGKCPSLMIPVCLKALVSSNKHAR